MKSVNLILIGALALAGAAYGQVPSTNDTSDTNHNTGMGTGALGSTGTNGGTYNTASGFFADRSIDWVRLDARHELKQVQADIRAWLPKVRVSGWLSGDDYDEIKWPGVVTAVRELLPEARPWSSQQWRRVVS